MCVWEPRYCCHYPQCILHVRCEASEEAWEQLCIAPGRTGAPSSERRGLNTPFTHGSLGDRWASSPALSARVIARVPPHHPRLHQSCVSPLPSEMLPHACIIKRDGPGTAISSTWILNTSTGSSGWLGRNHANGSFPSVPWDKDWNKLQKVGDFYASTPKITGKMYSLFWEFCAYFDL